MESRPLVCIVISDVTRPVIFEWLFSSELAKKFRFKFILLHKEDTPFARNLKSLGADVKWIHHKGWKTLPICVLKILKIFLSDRPQAVHTHLLFANLAALTAAFVARVPVRVHTRHHSNPYHYKHKHALFYDKLAQMLSTKVVATCENVVRVLESEGLPKSKILKIYIGVKFDYFNRRNSSKMEEIKKKYVVGGAWPLVGMVSRYLEIKGLQYVIPSFARLLKQYPQAVLLLTNAVGGEYASEIREMIDKDLPRESIREIPFEEDMPSFYQILDLFIHVPVDPVSEAFGQSYTESLAAGVPAIFTLSGVAPEFLQHRHNSLVVDYRNSDEIFHGAIEILKDPKLRETLTENGAKIVKEKFSFDEYLSKHEELWFERT